MRIAELLGEIDVEPRDVADALGIDAGEIDRPAEGDAGEDRQLVRGIDAVDVEARIGLGVAELLRLGEHLGELAAALAHRRQDVVRGAVEDAVDARDSGCRRGFRASVLMIGMPPATAASKASATPASSARAASAVPCSAISALLAVTTCLPCASAVSTTLRARPRRCRRSARRRHRSPDRRPSRPRPRTSAPPTDRRRGRAAGRAPRPRRRRCARPARTASSSAWRSQQLQGAGADGAEPGDGDLQRRLHDRAGLRRSVLGEDFDCDRRRRPAPPARRRLDLDLVGRRRRPARASPATAWARSSAAR